MLLFALCISPARIAQTQVTADVKAVLDALREQQQRRKERQRQRELEEAAEGGSDSEGETGETEDAGGSRSRSRSPVVGRARGSRCGTGVKALVCGRRARLGGGCELGCHKRGEGWRGGRVRGRQART